MSAGVAGWLSRWVPPPSYPAGIPPPLGRAPRATKGGSVTFSDLGLAIKNFPGKILPQNRAYPPSITKTPKKFSRKFTPQVVSL